jgi:hypothetical protein
MDRLDTLAADLTRLIDEIRDEVDRQQAREFAAPIAWLGEANGWLQYELDRARHGMRDPVPFTYLPLELRRS